MKKVLQNLMSAIALSYLPLIFIIPAVINDPAATIKLPYILIFIILFIYSVPFFAIYLEICSLVSFFLEKREYGKFEKTLKLIGAVLTLGAAVAVFFINKFPAVCFTLAGAVGVLLTVELIYRLRSKKAFSSLKRKQTWIFALILTVVVSGIFFAVNTAENAEAKPNPVAPTLCIRTIK